MAYLKHSTGRFSHQGRSLALSLLILGVLTLAAPTLRAQVSFSYKSYALKNLPFQVVVGDFNQDGRPDIAVLSLNGGTVSVLLTNSDGTLSPPRDFPAITPQICCNSFFTRMIVGDVNGDGKLDLVIGDSANVAGPSVNVLLGGGDGTFGAPVLTLVNLVDASALIGVADFNGDKKLDVAVLGDDGNAQGPVALLGNGDGTFTPRSISTTSPALFPCFVADINQDGRADIVGTEGSTLFVFLGNGDGTFQSPSQIPEQTTWSAVMVTGDFNRDGKIDLVSTSFQDQICEFRVCHPNGPGGALAVLLGSGNNSFGGPGVLAYGDFGPAAVGDFDGDGNPDIAASGPAGASSPSSIYFGNGRGAFPKQLGFGLGASSSMVSADLNSDGLSDIAVVAPSSSSLVVALNTTPGFTVVTQASSPPISPGDSAKYTIGVGQQNGFNSSVHLTCSVPGQGMACSVSPTSIIPGGTSTLTVTTTGVSSSLARLGVGYAWLPAIGLLFATPVFGGRRTSRTRNLCGLMLLCLIWSAACGGGNSSMQVHGTPLGNYTITVTGTSGSVQRSAVATLTVQ